MNEELREELKGTILENIDKELLSPVPPIGYFDTLADNVLTSVQEKKSDTTIPRIYSLRRLAAAASVMVLAGAFYWYLVPKSVTEMPLDFTKTSEEDLLDYVYDDLELNDIAVFDEIELSTSGLSYDLTELSEEEISRYLEMDMELNELIDFL